MEIRKGSTLDTERFISLLQTVQAGMGQQEWLYVDPPEEIRKTIQDGILEFWLAMDGEQVAGAFSVVYPGLTDQNYGYDLGFSEEDLFRVVNMDTIAVHPNYRGKGLQYTLMQRAEKDVSVLGKKILLCTVHPDNHFSLRNILAQGYTVEKRLEKYGSVRYILRKDI